MLSDLNLSSDEDYWIGLNDIDSEGDFVSSDGNDNNWAIWTGTEPNGRLGSNCARLK